MPLFTAQAQRPAILVLGEGAGGRRAGGVQRLAEPLDGEPVLLHTVRHALASGLPVVVVTVAPFAQAVGRLVATRDVVVLGTEEGAIPGGRGAAIAAGVGARTGAAGWLVLPGDMPLVRPDTLRRVGAELARHPVAFAQFKGRRGHPVGFSAELFSELVRLQGDDAPRRLVARYPAQPVEGDDPGVLLDLDKAEDLALLRQQWQARRPVPRLAAPLVSTPK